MKIIILNCLMSIFIFASSEMNLQYKLDSFDAVRLTAMLKKSVLESPKEKDLNEKTSIVKYFFYFDDGHDDNILTPVKLVKELTLEEVRKKKNDYYVKVLYSNGKARELILPSSYKYNYNGIAIKHTLDEKGRIVKSENFNENFEGISWSYINETQKVIDTVVAEGKRGSRKEYWGSSLSFDIAGKNRGDGYKIFDEYPNQPMHEQKFNQLQKEARLKKEVKNVFDKLKKKIVIKNKDEKIIRRVNFDTYVIYNDFYEDDKLIYQVSCDYLKGECILTLHPSDENSTFVI